jgi:hypothetical protein
MPSRIRDDLPENAAAVPFADRRAPRTDERCARTGDGFHHRTTLLRWRSDKRRSNA